MKQLPAGWRWTKLREVCEVIAGQSPPGHTYRKTAEGLPFFQGKADFGLRHPIAQTWCVEPNKLARPGDILISVRAPVGPTNVADVDCCIGRGLAAIRPSEQADRDFILAGLKLYEPDLAKLGSGSTFHAINRDILESLEIPLPSLAEQRRIAGVLRGHMAAVHAARRSADAQMEAAQALPARYLRTVFARHEARAWPKKHVAEVCELLPSKPIATAGDAEVVAITSACLSESGFLPEGVKTARMWAGDAKQCIVAEGEVLIARSNTPELVGRAAMFGGKPDGAVASDLTIRLKMGDDLLPPFLAAYMSFLYLSGYWKERAGGASGTMKKITRTQIRAEEIPVPPLADQGRVAAELAERLAGVERLRRSLAEQLAVIEKLPAALLRRAFSGGL